jgi:ABC-type bacteriocin/lantibiotic exporter with double-glycine peptidase domain
MRGRGTVTGPGESVRAVPLILALMVVGCGLTAERATDPKQAAALESDAAAPVGVSSNPGALEAPMVLQEGPSDCGAAALAMTLRHYGIAVEIGDLRRELDGGPRGTSARRILEVARLHGLVAKGFVYNRFADALLRTQPGDIIFWDLGHFVVFEESLPGDRGIRIADPAVGRRVVSIAEADRSYTGVLLLFDLERAGTPSRFSSPLFK